MGISITQPAPQVDRSYTPRIIGVTRLWGGTNYLANLMAEFGLNAVEISKIMEEDYDYAIFDDLACLYASGYPMLYYEIKTGKPVEYLETAPTNIKSTLNDLTGRYLGYQNYYTSPTTYSAQSGNFAIYDEVFNTSIQLPLTQDDINTINEILALGNENYAPSICRVISPMADYIIVSALWGNGNGDYIEWHATYKAITEIEPWV